MTAQRSPEAATRICPVDRLTPDRGVAALVDGNQVAIFLLSGSGCDGAEIRAVGNHDPFSGANVIARGLIGSEGGTVYVASPMYKQRFDLETGRCLDTDSVSLRTWPVRVEDGWVIVGG